MPALFGALFAGGQAFDSLPAIVWYLPARTYTRRDNKEMKTNGGMVWTFVVAVIANVVGSLIWKKYFERT